MDEFHSKVEFWLITLNIYNKKRLWKFPEIFLKKATHDVDFF